MRERMVRAAARAAAGLALAGLAALGAGCGDGGVAPRGLLDPALVGTWAHEFLVADESGVVLCEFDGVEIEFLGTGLFRERWYDPVTGRAEPCPDRTLAGQRTGSWWVPAEGMLTFDPPPFGLAPGTVLEYSVEGDSLRFGPVLVLERRP